jgi:deoxyribonuclease V
MVNVRRLHSWNLTPTEAVALQKRLRARVVLEPLPAPVSLVAGADVSFDKYSDVVYAGFVVVRLPNFEVVETVGVTTRVTFPYVPGLLSFRETPALLKAWRRLRTRPDVVAIDGQGFAHPRRFGIACHVGLLFGVPTVGFGKTRLVGSYEEPGLEAGSSSPLVDKGEEVGAVVRTKARTNPIFVSPGDHADTASAVALALRCTRKCRVPEPTRLAHLYVNALRRGDAWAPPPRADRG